MTPSRHGCKIVDRDVKPQYNKQTMIGPSHLNEIILKGMYEGGSESSVIGAITLLIDIIGCCIIP